MKKIFFLAFLIGCNTSSAGGRNSPKSITSHKDEGEKNTVLWPLEEAPQPVLQTLHPTTETEEELKDMQEELKNMVIAAIFKKKEDQSLYITEEELKRLIINTMVIYKSEDKSKEKLSIFPRESLVKLFTKLVNDSNTPHENLENTFRSFFVESSTKEEEKFAEEEMNVGIKRNIDLNEEVIEGCKKIDEKSTEKIRKLNEQSIENRKRDKKIMEENRKFEEEFMKKYIKMKKEDIKIIKKMREELVSQGKSEMRLKALDTTKKNTEMRLKALDTMEKNTLQTLKKTEKKLLELLKQNR